MLEFQRKKEIRKVLYSPIIIIVLGIIIIFFLKGTWNVYKKERLSEQNLQRDKVEFQKISEREKSLNSSLNYLNTEKGIENEIRSKFRAVKEGEKVSVIIDDEKSANNDIISTSTNEADNESHWYGIFNWF